MMASLVVVVALGAKSPTTPEDLSLGIRSCLEKSGVPLSKAASFVHGSTIAINKL